MKYVKFLAAVVLLIWSASNLVHGQTEQFSKRRMTVLNNKLPSKIRQFLMTATRFEIQSDTVTEPLDVKPVYRPDRRFVVKSTKLRRRILRSFYTDISHANESPTCFDPNHLILARKGSKTVRISIGFGCGKFVVSGAFGTWNRGISTREGGLAEQFFNRLLNKYGRSLEPR